MYYIARYIIQNNGVCLSAVLDTSDYILEFITGVQEREFTQNKVRFIDFERYNVPIQNKGWFYLKDHETYLDFSELIRYNNVDFNSLHKTYKHLQLHCKSFIKKVNFLSTIPVTIWHIVKLEDNIFTISNDANGESFTVTKPQLSLIRGRGDKVIDDTSKKLGGGAIVADYRNYASANASLNYSVLCFLNRMILELGDIPHEVERLVESVNSGERFTPKESGSHWDYAVGLASDYEDVRQFLPPKELYKVYYRQQSKYSNVFEIMQGIANNVKWKKVGASEDDWKKFLAMTGLPIWFLPLIKDDLYCLKY